MKILALDSGAKRMGWAVLEGMFSRPPSVVKWVDSGIWDFLRDDNEEFQKYKLELIKITTKRAQTMFNWHDIDEVVAETIPAVGGGNFIAATQSYLANVAVTAVLTVATVREIPIFQIGATTVKKKIGGKGDATKVRVRNGVYHFFPFLKDSRGELWKKIHDESDAIGIGLAHFGYQIPK